MPFGFWLMLLAVALVFCLAFRNTLGRRLRRSKQVRHPLVEHAAASLDTRVVIPVPVPPKRYLRPGEVSIRYAGLPATGRMVARRHRSVIVDNVQVMGHRGDWMVGRVVRRVPASALS